MTDNSLEDVGVRLKPVHHESTKGGTHSTDAILVNDILLVSKDVAETRDDILVGEGTPVANDGLCEPLAICITSVEVGGEESEALVGDVLRVPSVTPLDGPAGFRATMDVHDEWMDTSGDS